MDFVQSLRDRAAALGGTVVLPETDDDRILQAAGVIRDQSLATVILVGSTTTVTERLAAVGTDPAGLTIIDPLQSTYRTEFSRRYLALRSHKGMTAIEADRIMAEPLFFAAMLVRQGVADGMVAGAANATGDVLRAGFQIVGPATEGGIVSSCFVMAKSGWDYGDMGRLVFADCAVVPQPDPDQLAAIALASAATARSLCDFEPQVAMLSYSTAGSGAGPDVDKVIAATEKVRAQAPDLAVDGPLQLDAAIDAGVAARKAPDSPVAGRANVLVFPDLDAGNIGYKLVQRLAGADAIGPVLQGMAKGVNDLSRGCSVDDVVNVSAITLLQGGSTGPEAAGDG